MKKGGARGKVGKSRVSQEEEDLRHSLPVSEMGDYASIMSKRETLRDPLEDEETAKWREKNMFGNPYRMDKKVSIDEADEASQVDDETASVDSSTSTSSTTSTSSSTSSHGTVPKRRIRKRPHRPSSPLPTFSRNKIPHLSPSPAPVLFVPPPPLVLSPPNSPASLVLPMSLDSGSRTVLVTGSGSGYKAGRVDWRDVSRMVERRYLEEYGVGMGGGGVGAGEGGVDQQQVQQVQVQSDGEKEKEKEELLNRKVTDWQSGVDMGDEVYGVDGG
ncbi:hypothetical protein HK102_013011, partial [Quaeritorhiza haematococci]